MSGYECVMWEVRDAERSGGNHGVGSSESGGGGSTGQAGRCARCWLSIWDMLY